MISSLRSGPFSPSLRWFLFIAYAVCLIASFPFGSTHAANAGSTTQGTLNRPVKDDAGRFQYIVDLKSDATRAYPTDHPPADGFPDWHKPAMRHLNHALEKQYGFKSSIIVSLVGNSLVAYLTPSQADALKRDQRVARVTADTYLTPSENRASFIEDFTSNGKTLSWGTIAVGGGKVSSSYNPTDPSSAKVTVYVLDGGVAYHTNLPNVAHRVAALSELSPSDPKRISGINPVSCYSHATHVAGIIGATTKNSGTGSVGVFPGVRIVSVSYNDKNISSATGACSVTPGDLVNGGGVAAGLDYIKQQIINTGKIGIVNMSFNGGGFAFDGTIGPMMKALSLPDPNTGYKGAFIVQSAGNNNADACTYAYHAAVKGAYDDHGIMVVGAVNRESMSVTPNDSEAFVMPGAKFGFNQSSDTFYGPLPPGIREREFVGSEIGSGSNFGACVDVWAPGQRIYSTFADPQHIFNDVPGDRSLNIDGTGDGNPTPSSFHATISGTSFAAPHIAGLAAYFAEQLPVPTPFAIETEIRKIMASTGTNDQAGLPIKVPFLRPGELTAWTPLPMTTPSRAAFRRNIAEPGTPGYLVVRNDFYYEPESVNVGTAGSPIYMFIDPHPNGITYAKISDNTVTKVSHLEGTAVTPIAMANLGGNSPRLMMITLPQSATNPETLVSGSFDANGNFGGWSPLMSQGTPWTSKAQVSMAWFNDASQMYVGIRNNNMELMLGKLDAAGNPVSVPTIISGIVTPRVPTLGYHPDTKMMYIVAVADVDPVTQIGTLKLGKWNSGGQFQSWEILPGVTTKSPVSFAYSPPNNTNSDNGKLYLFVQTADNKIAFGYFDKNGAFSGFTVKQDWIATTGPVAATDSLGNIQLVTRGDDNRLYMMTHVTQSSGGGITLPPVTISATPDNPVAPATITLTATVGANTGRVDFYYGATLIGTKSEAPFALSFSGLPAGTYADIKAVATDNAGVSTTSAAISITVANSAPQVSISATPANPIAPATVTMTAATSGDITKVDFYYGNSLIGTKYEAPFALSIAGLPAGTYADIKAIATDQAGISVTSAAISVTVLGSAPQVSISASPANPIAPATVTLTATASGTISKVDFYYGASLIGTKYESPFAVNFAGLPAGTYADIKAVATDNAGVSTTSAAISFVVSNGVDTTKPTVAITQPANNATITGDIMISANASDNVNVQSLQFLLDGMNFGPPLTAPPYNKVLNTSFLLANGNHTLGARATDAVGNTAVSTVAVTVNLPDSSSPVVAITQPATGATVSGTITVVATATDNVGVKSVQFLLDSQPFGPVFASPPYITTLNTGSIAVGGHTLTVRAFDAAGNSGATDIFITVNR